MIGYANVNYPESMFFIQFEGQQLHHFEHFEYVFTVAMNYCKNNNINIEIWHYSKFENQFRLITTLKTKR